MMKNRKEDPEQRRIQTRKHLTQRESKARNEMEWKKKKENQNIYLIKLFFLW